MENGNEDYIAPRQQLLALWCDSNPAHRLFAVVNVHTDPVYVRNLARSAASDASREAAESQKTGDFDWIKTRIVLSLSALGFKFVELNTMVNSWEILQNEPTLIETRLRADGVSFTHSTTTPGVLKIPTTQGDITVDLKNREWQGPYTYLGIGTGCKTRTEGFLSTVAGYDYMLTFIEKHFEPASA